MPAATKPNKAQMIDLAPDDLWLVQQLQSRVSESPDHVDDIAASLTAGKRLRHRVQVIRLVSEEQPDGFREPLPVGTNLVVDGFHTVRAVRKANTETGKSRKVPCTVTEGTYRDAKVAAAGANEHPDSPLKRTREDKRRAVELYLSVFPRSSLRVAAAHCHVTHPFVHDIKKRLAGPAEPATEEGADDGESEAGNTTTPADGADEPRVTSSARGNPERAMVDWADLESLYGKLRRGFAHVAEVHGDLVDKADKDAVEKLLNEAFDLVFATGKTPASWKARILKKTRK